MTRVAPLQVALCVHMLLFFHSVCSMNTSDELDEYARGFCKYMKSTPEPRVLIYNRVPKCGSQTLTNILHQIQRHDPSIDQASRWRQYWWPRDMDTNSSLARDFSDTVKRRLASRRKVRIAGHWYWHTFNAVKDFGLKKDSDVEYINILRKCSARFKSQLLFELFDTKEAKAAASSNRIEAHHNSLLYDNITAHECIESYSCLNTVFKTRILKENNRKLTGMMVEFLSGTNAMKMEGNSYYRGALKHLNKVDVNDEGYSAIGFLEFYEESLELLECAYPRFFRHALPIYINQKTHMHRSSVSKNGTLYDHPNFERVLQPICDLADNSLYDIAINQFWSKIRMIRKNKRDCCRVLQ